MTTTTTTDPIPTSDTVTMGFLRKAITRVFASSARRRGVGALGEGIDGRRQLVAGLVDLLLDGIGIAVHHVLSSKFSSRPLPACVARRTTLDQ